MSKYIDDAAGVRFLDERHVYLATSIERSGLDNITEIIEQLTAWQAPDTTKLWYESTSRFSWKNGRPVNSGRILKDWNDSQQEFHFRSKDLILISFTPARILQEQSGGALTALLPQRVNDTDEQEEADRLVDWDRWHELLDIRDTRGLNEEESLEYATYQAIVDKLDRAEERSSLPGFEDRSRNQKEVLALIERLTEVIRSSSPE